MPTYEFKCLDCEYEFEELYLSAVTYEKPPCEKCKSCNVMRLISGGSGKGIVSLNADEIKEDVRKGKEEILKKCRNSESFLANCIGEQKYENRIKEAERANADFKGCFRRSK